jgi:hypothetical protein
MEDEEVVEGAVALATFFTFVLEGLEGFASLGTLAMLE